MASNHQQRQILRKFDQKKKLYYRCIQVIRLNLELRSNMFAAIISSNYRPLKIQFESIYIVCQHDGAEKKKQDL